MKPRSSLPSLWHSAQAKAPVLGILAFSAASINSVANLFLERAVHPTPVLWYSAALVEMCTAWLVYQVVDVGRKLTRSRISKEDRRFYSGMFVGFLLLTLPSLILSVAANTLEFGVLGLGVIFPVLSVACAVGLALPATVEKYEKDRTVERVKAKAAKAEKEEAKAIEQLAPAPPVVALSPKQLAQVKQVLAVYTENESALLRDLWIDGLIGSDSVASRARKMAVEQGYLVATATGYTSNGKTL